MLGDMKMEKESKTGWIATIFLFILAITLCLVNHFTFIESLVVLGMISLLMSIMWWAIKMCQIIDRMGR